MKRKAIKHLNIRNCSPLFFWKFCSVCGREFRRENGLVEINILGYEESYCCEDCKDIFIRRVEDKRKEWLKDLKEAVGINYDSSTTSKKI